MKKSSDAAPAKADGSSRRAVLMMDDHPLVREGLATIIQSTDDLCVSASVGTPEELKRALEKKLPDIMVLDISMPKVDGIDLLKDLRTRYPDIPVLFISMHEEGVYAERALRAGAQGYIMKMEPSYKLVEAIRSVLRGEMYVSPALAARILSLFVSGAHGSDLRTGVERLSDRELQVYTQIGQGLATKEVAARLHLSSKTVQTYREHIKRKLGLRNATDLVHHATHWVEKELGRGRAAT